MIETDMGGANLVGQEMMRERLLPEIRHKQLNQNTTIHGIMHDVHCVQTVHNAVGRSGLSTARLLIDIAVQCLIPVHFETSSSGTCGFQKGARAAMTVQ
jgi:hypothetical protein